MPVLSKILNGESGSVWTPPDAGSTDEVVCTLLRSAVKRRPVLTVCVGVST